MSDFVTLQLTVDEARLVVSHIGVAVRAANDCDHYNDDDKSGARARLTQRIRQDAIEGAFAFIERLDHLLPNELERLETDEFTDVEFVARGSRGTRRPRTSPAGIVRCLNPDE